MTRFSFSYDESPLNNSLGFREGAQGTHTSRTMMSTELARLLEAGADASSAQRLIVEENILGKATMAGRRLALQRLRELYALDRTVPVYQVLADLWKREPQSLPQLALLAALARDPLLRVTAKPILVLPPGRELVRDEIRHAISTSVGARLNPATLDKVVRNTASSWTQSGHLVGHTFKKRRRIEAKPAALAFAIWLAQASGFTGNDVLSNGWVTTLDLDQERLEILLERVRAAGLVEIRQLGPHVEINSSRLLTRAAA